MADKPSGTFSLVRRRNFKRPTPSKRHGACLLKEEGLIQCCKIKQIATSLSSLQRKKISDFPEGLLWIVTSFVAKAINVFNLFADLKVSAIKRISLNLKALHYGVSLCLRQYEVETDRIRLFFYETRSLAHCLFTGRVFTKLKDGVLLIIKTAISMLQKQRGSNQTTTGGPKKQ
ncbi:MAG: hypothetical protein A2499_09440 [Stygiobacter sp. RIFOXYC12_FULL_38_8]|nr:MAG: hypothetical protein A2X62_07810 [Stygiobacter sp. GWC2_38_9]OGV06403.1 MAG: hypothetical protein A2299_15035 [Stygiobacter sp. RIFOXYB2_FULL_37_11]OGV13997.1 MAG: hypothetical protein A2440_18725 [Stygiobacter sp. RIFOXYC2_FULL_38_25]OGV14384.1 MAG: hypothetical protein A2237_00190 [Stygiobacter sp. RIFOXYA2_FULL_38_8]OGV26096.1 MAG: hypothetical protein A2499_09440 [Stygiobacter sp. RIFOXYC12_FULL_38_8]OGV82328.1 MAG: hypothetical protein A2X65_18210 [Stygiobacter sp. GWF2_38_21]RJQ